MSGVLVVMEQRGGVLNRMSLEAVAAGQLLAAKLGLECSAAVLGEGAGSLGAKGGGEGYSVGHALLKDYTADGYVAALEQLVKKLEPKYVLFPHTYQVRDFAPKLATRFGQVLMSDVVAIHDGAVGNPPVFVRQLLQGKLNADYRQTDSTSAGPCFVSVQAGSFRADAEAAGEAAVEVFVPELTASQVRRRGGGPVR